MLVLTREKGREILIGEDIRIKVCRTGQKVKLGVEAPNHVSIRRAEIDTERPARVTNGD